MGAVFNSDNADGKSITCGLSDPGSWIGEKVLLEIEGSTGTLLCRCNVDDKGNADDHEDNVFSCDEDTAQCGVKNPSEVKVKYNLDTNIDSTTVFRCNVKVGDDGDEATDTKLIYAEKIGLYSINNLL